MRAFTGGLLYGYLFCYKQEKVRFLLRGSNVCVKVSKMKEWVPVNFGFFADGNCIIE